MNSDQFFSALRSGMKLAGAWAIQRGYLTGSLAGWISGAILSLAGWGWSHVTHKSVPADGKLPIKFNLLALLVVAALLSACSSVTEHGYQFSTTTRVFGVRVVTTTQPNSTPEIDLGLVSSTTFLNPTSTNGPINAARYMNSLDVQQTINPFDTGIREQIGAGDVYLGGTNDVNKAIVPSAFTPLHASAVTVTTTNTVTQTNVIPVMVPAFSPVPGMTNGSTAK